MFTMSLVNLISGLLFAREIVAANIPASSSSYSNSSSITTQSAVTTIPPSNACCVIVPQTVGLNFWWNSSLEVTYATVLTQYLQYNNTVIPNTTTIYNISATDGLVPPSDIIPGYLLYSATKLEMGTTIDLPSTTITYPTPYVAIHSALYLAGTLTSTAGAQKCEQDAVVSFNFNSMVIHLPSEYDYVPAGVTSTYWSEGTYLDAPTGLKDEILAMPTITERFPMIASCTVVSGSGEPSVHLPVSALTTHATTTIAMVDSWPETTTSAPEVTTAPSPSSPEVSPPVSTSQVALPEISSSAKEPPPGSSTTDVPPSSSAINAPPSTANNAIPTSQNQQSSALPTPPASLQIGTTLIPISFASASATGIVLPGGSTLTPGASPTPPASLQIGTTLIPISFASASAPGIVLPGGATLTPGAVTTISGIRVSLFPSATVILVGSSTVALAPPSIPTANVPSLVVIPLGSSTLTAAIVTATGGGIVLPGGGTLLPGSTTVIGDQTISLVPSSSAVVIGSSTIPIVTVTPTPTSPTAFVIGPSSLPLSYATASGGGIVLPNGVTLLPGSTAVYNAVTISLAPSGTVIVVAGSTVALSPPATTRGLGGSIVSGLGTTESGTAEYTGPQATGAAERLGSVAIFGVLGIAVLVGYGGA